MAALILFTAWIKNGGLPLTGPCMEKGQVTLIKVVALDLVLLRVSDTVWHNHIPMMVILRKTPL